MKCDKLAETVLLQLEHFFVLQEIDEAWRHRDTAATKFLDRIYKERAVAPKDVIPYLRLNTTISLLIVPLSFVARFSDEQLSEFGFAIKKEYDLRLSRNGEAVIPTSQEVLRVLRNAIAHLSDFAAGENHGDESPNISFDEGILRCRSGTCELVFESESGFFYFLRELHPAIRKAAARLLKDMTAVA